MLARREARNFYYAFLAPAGAERRSMCALYAFLRHTDDLADEPGSAGGQSPGARRLAARARGGVGRPRARSWPGLPALADTVARHSIPADLLDEGDRWGLDGRRAAPVRDVRRSRGLLLSRRLGRRAWLPAHLGLSLGGRQGRALAESCGIALQLTNILRDVREDARNGRIYLPEEDLARFGVEPRRAAVRTAGRAIASGRCWPSRASVPTSFTSTGRPLAPLVDPVGRPVLRTIVGIYRALLDEIARRDYNVLSARVSGSAVAKDVRSRCRRASARTICRRRFPSIDLTTAHVERSSDSIATPPMKRD